MLILTRKAGESIVIGDGTKVSIPGMATKQLRTGIDVAKDISVHREEIYNRLLP